MSTKLDQVIKQTKRRTNGVVLYEGKSLLSDQRIVAIATFKSSNEKTGDMVQVWILPADLDPLQAIQTNDNSGACGRCALQGTADESGKMHNRVCYVNVGQAPLGIWRAWQSGSYPQFDKRLDEWLLKDREIRIGAYGDPAALPVSLVRYLATVGRSWTGYSHQLLWIRRDRADALSELLMCSTHNKAQLAEARRRGYRSFHAIPAGAPAPADSVECPFYTANVQCRDCQLCQGTSKQAKDVYVIAHAKVGLNLAEVVQAGV